MNVSSDACGFKGTAGASWGKARGDNGHDMNCWKGQDLVVHATGRATVGTKCRKEEKKKVEPNGERSNRPSICVGKTKPTFYQKENPFHNGGGKKKAPMSRQNVSTKFKRMTRWGSSGKKGRGCNEGSTYSP